MAEATTRAGILFQEAMAEAITRVGILSRVAMAEATKRLSADRTVKPGHIVLWVSIFT
jgi:hypothetical protein